MTKANCGKSLLHPSSPIRRHKPFNNTKHSHTHTPSTSHPPLHKLHQISPTLESLLSQALLPYNATMSSSNKSTKSTKSTKPTTKSRNKSPDSERPQRGRRTAPTSTHRCEVCNQYYSRRDNLRVHQRVHSGEMPYECRYCGQRFRWMGALRSHEANHARDGHSPRKDKDKTKDSSTTSASRHPAPRPSTTSRQQPKSTAKTASAKAPKRTGSSTASRQSSLVTQNTLHRNNSRDHKSASASRRPQQMPPLQFADNLFFGQDIMFTEEDPSVSPMVVEEPWHDVLDDRNHWFLLSNQCLFGIGSASSITEGDRSSHYS